MSVLDHRFGGIAPTKAVSAFAWAVLAVSVAAATFLYWSAISHTWEVWMTSSEYNYGPMIPIIAGLMVWRDLRRSTAPSGAGWGGVAILLLGLIFGLFGEIAAFVFLAQIGLFLFVIGLFAATIGDRRAFSVWPGLVYLGFAIPLAKLLQSSLSDQLQLISSQLGTMFIRLFGIPVFLEGNVIDLGLIQLQVAEACSGLRYLFPLASFAFLCAYLIRSPRWQRVVIFVSALPITILLNSFRIGITGVLVNSFGIEAAQGFFHDFEGWLVFCSCIAVLFLEMKLLCYFGGDRSLLRRLDLSWPDKAAPGARFSGAEGRNARLAAGGLTVIAFATFLSLGDPDVLAPSRTSFAGFPSAVGAWQSSDAPISPEALDVLKPTDYLSRNFANPSDGGALNLWIAYYASQGIGETIHSPRICIPGGGWKIVQIEPVTLNADSSSAVINANRAVIERQGERQLVYYWFQGRGRYEASEYSVKLHLMHDALVRHRTDGALVRVVVPMSEATGGIAASESKARAFIAQVQPTLVPYLPD